MLTECEKNICSFIGELIKEQPCYCQTLRSGNYVRHTLPTDRRTLFFIILDTVIGKHVKIYALLFTFSRLQINAPFSNCFFPNDFVTRARYVERSRSKNSSKISTSYVCSLNFLEEVFVKKKKRKRKRKRPRGTVTADSEMFNETRTYSLLLLYLPTFYTRESAIFLAWDRGESSSSINVSLPRRIQLEDTRINQANYTKRDFHRDRQR